MKNQNNFTEKELNEIYDILVEHCGTDPRQNERSEFIKEHLKTDYPQELRICPKLGSGGKFKRNGKMIWVSFYAETKTKEIIELSDKVNEMLKKIQK